MIAPMTIPRRPHAPCRVARTAQSRESHNALLEAMTPTASATTFSHVSIVAIMRPTLPPGDGGDLTSPDRDLVGCRPKHAGGRGGGYARARWRVGISPPTTGV